MAVGGDYFSISKKATAALTQFVIVKPSTTAGECKIAAAATDSIIGVVQNNPGAGEAAEIAVSGVCKVLAEASVAAGDHVTSSTTGRAKTTTTSNNHVLGVAQEASSAAGDVIKVNVSLGNY